MAEDRVGQRLGNYRLVRLLGKGGFAEVYLGEHLRLNTQAAIKVLHTRLAGEEEIEAFQQEAQTIARLVHPHIVRVLDFDVADDTPFLVMDYAANGTLRQKHPKGTRLAPAQVLPYVKQAAEALQYAHEHKLIHRDIKPENLLLGEHDQILLSDFGIALVAQSSRYQNTQEVVGTMAYMAPEQLQGHPRPASDQYALAITVYEWLTGDRPFHGSFSEIFSQQMFVPPRPLRDTLPELAPAIEEVILTALAKDPKERFGSARAFANAFAQACQDAALLNAPTQRVSPPGPVAPPTAHITPPTPQPATTIAVPPSRAPVEPPPPATVPPPVAGTDAAAVTSIPPGWRDVPRPAPQAPAARAGSPPAPPRSAAGAAAPPARELARPRRRARPMIIRGSVILILAVIIVGGIALLKPSSASNAASASQTATVASNAASATQTAIVASFHQEVTTGAHITSIQVGTGFDTGSLNVTDIFHVGETIYIGFTVSSSIVNIAELSFIQGNTIVFKTSLYASSGSYTGGYASTTPGIDKWEVDYNGTPEASITFLVLA